MRYLYSLLVFLFLTVSAHATNYYFCDTGNDTTGDGSIGNPWASWDKATATLNSGSAGDGIFLCSGGSFAPSSQTTITTDCTSSDMCTFSAYGSGDRPEITGGGPRLDSASYINFSNLSFMSTWTSGSGDTGAFLNAENQHITFDNVKFEGFYVAINIVASFLVDDPQTYIDIKNSQFVNNSGFGIIGSSTFGRVYGNTFDRNGVDAFTRPEYISGGTTQYDENPDYIQGVVVSGNTYINNAPGDIGNGAYAGSWTSGTYGCVSTVVGGHGIHIGTTIKNNIVREEKATAALASGGCWGFSLDTAWPEIDEHFVNLLFQNNENYYAGNVMYSCSNCDGVIFRENIGYGINSGIGMLAANRTEDTPHPTETISAYYNLLVHEKVDTSNAQKGIEGRHYEAAAVIADLHWNVLIFPDDDAFNYCTYTDAGSDTSDNFCFEIDSSGDFFVSTNYITK